MATTDLERLSRARRLASDGTARSLRQAAALSIGDVARQARLATKTVARYESGERRPSGDSAIRYLAVIELLEKVAAS